MSNDIHNLLILFIYRSICLLIQAVLPCVMFAKDQKMKINLRGGTNADMAPPIDYMIKVLININDI